MYKKMWFVICAVLLVGSAALANDWIGGASGDWSNPANWSAGTVPGAADDVTSSQKEAFWTPAEWTAIVGNDPWTYVPATNSFSSWVHQTINTAASDVISVAAIHTSNSGRMVSTVLNINCNVAVAGDFKLSDSDYTCTTVNQYSGDVTVGGELTVPYRYRGIYNVYGGTLTASTIKMVGRGSGFAFTDVDAWDWVGNLTHKDGVHPFQTAASELNIYDGAVVTANALIGRNGYVPGGDPEWSVNRPMPKVTLSGDGMLRLTGDQSANIAQMVALGNIYGNGVAGAITVTLEGGYTVVQAIPEPISMLMLGLGGIAALRRRK